MTPEEHQLFKEFIDKHKSIYLNPESDDKLWCKAYLFDYTNPDLDKIKSLFNIKI